MMGSNGMQGMAGQSPDENLSHMSPYRHRIKQRERSIHNLSLQHTQPLDDNPAGERQVQPMVGIAQGKQSKYMEIIQKKQAIANMV